MNCQYCQCPLPPGVKNCPGCGAPAPVSACPQNSQLPQNPVPGMEGGQNTVNAKAVKSVGLAQFLSCLLPGLGQIYNGQVLKGIAVICANVLIASATVGFGYLAVLVAAIIDAGKIAKKINEGKAVGEWEFF